ncbi:MAG: acetyl-CoA carboxylase biotin carboxyl carrier protein subunit, partial [Lachnospiraceae bacterium]|nr:acetyl-CoA carboxylase biotin carboxyl carrier protein subunit [Lachnospiraceae bacterium]
AVKKGQVILILEAMKMENEIVAPQDGTIATINVATGDSVEPGATLATMN